MPSLFIRAKADRRQQELVNSFPDALDLMLVCVEAGLGLEASFSRVGMEMTASHPLVAEQFGAVVLELRAGRSHEDALRRIGQASPKPLHRAHADSLAEQIREFGYDVAGAIVHDGNMRRTGR